MSTDGHSERMKVLVIPAFPVFTKLKKTKEVKASWSNKDWGLANSGMIVDQSPRQKYNQLHHEQIYPFKR